MPSEPDLQVFFNPNCSKCKTVRGMLEERGLAADYIRYLEQAPSRPDLERVLGLLGATDPRQMMRVDEPVYAELGLEDASNDELFDAMARHPILIQRPIVIKGDKAVIGRPPERALDLFSD
jgi:arsenate reductase (glutaredoxin)